MIKIVPDANVLISGMLGTLGPTRSIINLSLAKKIVIFGSSITFQEFCDKIKLRRFQKYFSRQFFSIEKIILEYKAFVNMIESTFSDRDLNFIEKDPDDDEYVRVARACGSKILISRDNHLLDMKNVEDIIIVSPEKFMQSYRKVH